MINGRHGRGIKICYHPLSGCCRSLELPFIAIGGFDERYFLYLEDADITRSLSSVGRACIIRVHRSFMPGVVVITNPSDCNLLT